MGRGALDSDIDCIKYLAAGLQINKVICEFVAFLFDFVYAQKDSKLHANRQKISSFL